MRPLDIQSLLVRTLDVERMQQVMQQAQMIQQQQISQQNAMLLAESLAQVRTMQEGAHSDPATDSEPTDKEERTVSIAERRRRRHRFPDQDSDASQLSQTDLAGLQHIDLLI